MYSISLTLAHMHQMYNFTKNFVSTVQFAKLKISFKKKQKPLYFWTVVRILLGGGGEIYPQVCPAVIHQPHQNQPSMGKNYQRLKPGDSTPGKFQTDKLASIQALT